MCTCCINASCCSFHGNYCCGCILRAIEPAGHGLIPRRCVSSTPLILPNPIHKWDNDKKENSNSKYNSNNGTRAQSTSAPSTLELGEEEIQLHDSGEINHTFSLNVDAQLSNDHAANHCILGLASFPGFPCFLP